VVVNNVGADPRYLGSDMVKSNIVVPIFVNKSEVVKSEVEKSEVKKSEAKKRVVAELCIESYFADTFNTAEQKFIESCAALVGRRME